MKSMKDILFVIVGLAAAAVAILQIYKFLNLPGTNTGKTHLWIAIAAAVVACIFGVLFLLGRVNKEEEIHITQ
jgi:heme/copper-type cytochrome/quinol oxidase subunit 4